MALWEYALFSVEEARRFLGVGGSDSDEKIEDAINEASQMIEDLWGRQLISRGSLTEHHPNNGQYLGVDLYTNEYPVVSVTSVTEAGTVLTVDTDYRVIIHPESKLRRLSAGFPVGWPQTISTTTYRVIKVIYIAGYRTHNDTATTVPVAPEGVRRVGRELVAWIYSQRAGKSPSVGMQTVSDGLGSRTTTGPAYLTPMMKAALYAAGATAPGGRFLTGERDS